MRSKELKTFLTSALDPTNYSSLLQHLQDRLRQIIDVAGAHAGQVDAAKLAISKSISAMNEELRSTLKKAGLLKRDPREKERKKYGQKGARKRFQFSKR